MMLQGIRFLVLSLCLYSISTEYVAVSVPIRICNVNINGQIIVVNSVCIVSILE